MKYFVLTQKIKDTAETSQTIQWELSEKEYGKVTRFLRKFGKGEDIDK